MHSLTRRFGLFGAVVLCLAAMCLAGALPAQAHDLWVVAQQPEGNVFKADIGLWPQLPQIGADSG